MTSLPFEFLEHAADIKIKVKGKNLSQIFERITLAISHYLSGGTSVKKRLVANIELQGHDQSSLLYTYIDELLYLLDAEHFLVSKAEVIVEGNTLTATLYGDESKNYDLQHIKAATYAEMKI